ncbi:MerR family transcriptional regulator [Kineococcus sp. R8]|uniref:MerR family transcriptional regulator n=1 Tax=Kineococcus siccus TaxID=2696567 RepID=UPI00141353B8|nr:MerR family transcriptional regulator [Kineococcus siccus]NAZ82319.1 MerR family transcriptional regulator [Kineococcus siccus]
MMTIGQFSQASGLTAKALRFYDENGLLQPAEVDAASGYRRYSAAQLRRAATVKVLRDMGMPLAQVRVAVDEPDRCDAVVAAYRDELAAERARQDLAVRQGTAALAAYAAPLVVGTRRAARQPWAGVLAPPGLVDGTGDDDGSEAANGMFTALFTALAAAGNPPTGAWWSSVEPAPGSESQVRLLLCWPVERAVGSDVRVEGCTTTSGVLPERTEAFVRVGWAQEGEETPEGVPTAAMIALAEHAGAHGDPAGDDTDDGDAVRQVGVLAEDGSVLGVELVVTTAVHG